MLDLQSCRLAESAPVFGSFSLSSSPAMLWSFALGSPRAFTSSSRARIRFRKASCATPLSFSLTCKIIQPIQFTDMLSGDQSIPGYSAFTAAGMRRLFCACDRNDTDASPGSAFPTPSSSHNLSHARSTHDLLPAPADNPCSHAREQTEQCLHACLDYWHSTRHLTFPTSLPALMATSRVRPL